MSLYFHLFLPDMDSVAPISSCMKIINESSGDKVLNHICIVKTLQTCCVHAHTCRHEEQTWSMERTESVNSDCQSGGLSSSVGTSKCSSPACMARRAAHWGCTDESRPGMQYGDSYDSLRDSPHSDR